jgi:hypothetical protein
MSSQAAPPRPTISGRFFLQAMTLASSLRRMLQAFGPTRGGISHTIKATMGEFDQAAGPQLLWTFTSFLVIPLVPVHLKTPPPWTYSVGEKSKRYVIKLAPFTPSACLEDAEPAGRRAPRALPCGGSGWQARGLQRRSRSRRRA